LKLGISAVMNGTPIVSVRLELRNVSDWGAAMMVPWADAKFSCRVVDATGRELPESGGPFDGPVFPRRDLILPERAILSFDITCRGWGIPGDKQAMIAMDAEHDWVIERDGKDYYLMASLTAPQGEKRTPDGSMAVWHGQMDLPPVCIPGKPAPLDARKAEEIIRELGSRLLEKDSRISEEAIRRLSLIDDERVIPWYLKAMETNNYGLKFAALDRLSRFNGSEALRGLKKGMTTQGPDIGNCANDALAAQLADNVRHSAAGALARSPHPDAQRLLMSMWNDPYYGVRIEVLHALGKMRSEESLALLGKMTRDADQRVRDEALRYEKLRSVPTDAK
jgi:hypothetical protein